jgi:hypothetical protein
MQNRTGGDGTSDKGERALDLKREQRLTAGEGIVSHAFDGQTAVPCEAEPRTGSHLAEGDCAAGAAAPAEYSPRRKLDWRWVFAGVVAAGLLAYLGIR